MVQPVSTAPTRKPVLLVEDNVDDAFHFSRTLRSLGPAWELFTVPNVDAAMRYLTAAATDQNCTPSAVFVDLNLHGQDGGELIEWIRGKRHLRRCSVFAVSGGVEPAAPLRAQLRGASEFLPKPVNATALAFTLTRTA